jgi:hypothetical protein
MRRPLQLGLALIFAVVGYTAQAVYMPRSAMACSCIAPPPLAQLAATEPVTIIAGTIGVAQPDRTPISVETWFHGDLVTDLLWVSGGSNQVSSCDIATSAGQRWILVLWGGPAAPGANGLYSMSSCSPNGLIGTPEGNALLGEAIAAFGAGRTLAPAPESPAPSFDPSPWLGPGTVFAFVAVSAGLLLLVGVSLFSRKRSQD